MQGKEQKYINNWKKSVCTLGHDYFNALPHMDQYRFYSWPLALEAEGKPDLAFPFIPESAAAPGQFPTFVFFSFFLKFNPPGAEDNNNRTLSVSQWPAPNMRQFWKDHSAHFLRNWRDQQSPPRIRTNPTSGHIFTQEHKQTAPPVLAFCNLCHATRPRPTRSATSSNPHWEQRYSQVSWRAQPGEANAHANTARQGYTPEPPLAEKKGPVGHLHVSVQESEGATEVLPEHSSRRKSAAHWS